MPSSPSHDQISGTTAATPTDLRFGTPGQKDAQGSKQTAPLQSPVLPADSPLGSGTGVRSSGNYSDDDLHSETKTSKNQVGTGVANSKLDLRHDPEYQRDHDENYHHQHFSKATTATITSTSTGLYSRNVNKQVQTDQLTAPEDEEVAPMVDENEFTSTFLSPGVLVPPSSIHPENKTRKARLLALQKNLTASVEQLQDRAMQVKAEKEEAVLFRNNISSARPMVDFLASSTSINHFKTSMSDFHVPLRRKAAQLFFFRVWAKFSEALRGERDRERRIGSFVEELYATFQEEGREKNKPGAQGRTSRGQEVQLSTSKKPQVKTSTSSAGRSSVVVARPERSTTRSSTTNTTATLVHIATETGLLRVFDRQWRLKLFSKSFSRWKEFHRRTEVQRLRDVLKQMKEYNAFLVVDRSYTLNESDPVLADVEKCREKDRKGKSVNVKFLRDSFAPTASYTLGTAAAAPIK
ncbi:unnamed protein product [Amoebophrya sp. A120]|nr:unnamed protein product [Amoebophrya sp. A120]|eukprot:GSA120T00025391001.1